MTVFLLDTKTELENIIDGSDVTNSSASNSSVSDICSVKLYKSDGSVQILDYDWSIASVIIKDEESFIPYIYFKCEEGKRYRIEYCFNAWEGYANKPIFWEWGKDGVSGYWFDLVYNGETVHKGSFSNVLAGPDGMIKICPGIDGTVLSSSTAKLHMERFVLSKGFTIEIYE